MFTQNLAMRDCACAQLICLVNEDAYPMAYTFVCNNIYYQNRLAEIYC